jgi:CII-binding regulator of phage lambda lysogenization HflD
MSEERLSRIEDKLDKMSEAITLLARIEERMVTLFKRMDKHDDTMNKLVTRIEVIESGRTRTEVVSSFLTKIFWLVVGALVVTMVKLWSPGP